MTGLRDRSDWPTFGWLAHFSDRAYKESPTFEAAGCEVLVEHLSPDLTAVAFRGTADFHDAWMDARAVPWWDRDLGFCHRGFMIGVRAVWPDLERVLLGRRAIFTGHSKAGSETSLAAALACLNPGIYPVAVVPFGPARCVVGARVEKLYAARGVAYVRFEERGDPVPEVPLYLRHGGRFKIDLGEAWDPEADHPLVSNYLPDVLAWEATRGWSEVMA